MGLKRYATKSGEVEAVQEVIEEQAVPPDILLKLLMVEKRDNVIQGIEFYYRATSRGSDPGIEDIKSRLIALFYDVKASLKATITKAESQTIPFGSLEAMEKKLLRTDSAEELVQVFDFISDYLYRKGVLKFETTLKYDKRNVELANKLHGFG